MKPNESNFKKVFRFLYKVLRFMLFLHEHRDELKRHQELKTPSEENKPFTSDTDPSI